MAVYLRSQTTIPWVGSTMPNDQIVWSFSWMSDTNDPTAMAALIPPRLGTMAQALAAADTGNNPVKLTSSLDWARAMTFVYDWALPKPRVPILEVAQTGTLQSDTPNYVPLPHEVSLTVSYKAARVSGSIAARRRGRFYIGPLAISGVATDARNPPSLTQQAFLNVVSTYLNPGSDPFLAVYSRYTHWGLDVGEHPVKGEPPPEIPANLGASFSLVSDFWCDNRWDTQRRRGPAPTARLTLPASAD